MIETTNNRDDRNINAKIVIRKAEGKDAALLAELKQKISSESDFLSYGEKEVVFTKETETEFIREEMKKGNSVIILAFCENEIAGFVTCHGGNRVRKQHAGDMGIAVLKKYWGSGIGNALMNALILWAKETGVIRKINLLTRSDNDKAIHLYEKHGFCREGLISRDICINYKFYDAVAMGLCIDQNENKR